MSAILTSTCLPEEARAHAILLFKPKYYVRQCRSREARAAPFKHFVQQGWKRGLRPHPLFHTDYYLKQRPALSESGVCPLLHFTDVGWKENIRPHPLFDVGFYRRKYPNITWNPLVHFSRWGFRQRYNPHPLFDSKFYIETQQPAYSKKRKENPLEHYSREGWRIGLLPNPYWDPDFYRTSNPNADFGDDDPFLHFASRGWREGRSPSRDFNISRYFGLVPSLRQEDRNPINHFRENGPRLAEKLTPDIDVGWPLAVYHDLLMDPGLHSGIIRKRGRSGLPIPRRKVLFLHIPKTAGTSLKIHVMRQYSRGEMLFIYSRDVDSWTHQHDFPTKVREYINEVHGAMGHFTYGFHRHLPTPSAYATFLRDPVHRVISHFLHLVRDDPTSSVRPVFKTSSLWELLERKEDIELNNLMTRMIVGPEGVRDLGCEGWNNDTRLLAQALKNIERDFFFVGTTERLRLQVKLVGFALGWKFLPLMRLNVTRRARGQAMKVDPVLVRRIREENLLDLALYSKFHEHPLIRLDHLL